MDVFLGEWANLLRHWAHLIVGIGWIGSSFYFMALDYSLSKRERMNPGVLGSAWRVHGGGFYHVEKYTVAPAQLPPDLHWFQWEVYLTWVTGFGLMMVVPHYPFLFSNKQAWMVVALILIAGALIRHYLNRTDAGDDWGKFGWTAPVAAVALLAAIFVTAPLAPSAGGEVSDAQALAITHKHCTTCHAVNPTHEAFKEAPKNVALETIADLKKYAQLIYLQTVQNKAMPLGNQTAMTEDERAALGRWVRALK